MGMPSETFWHGDPKEAFYYKKAYDIKTEKENEILWLQGAYVYQAISCFVEFYAMAKNPKAKPYTEQFPITQEQAREREEKREKARVERIKQMMFAKAIDINKRKLK